MLVTAHQPNFLPGMSVLSKIEASDAIVWLDEVQYTKGGWTNRNKLPDKSWVTVPVERHCSFKPINRVRIGEPADEWKIPLTRSLREAWPGEVTERVCVEILRPYGLLVGLNVACLNILTAHLEIAQAFQSHLDGGHAVVSQGDDVEALYPISERLAMMVEELGGEVYLSGPSGRHYLDEEPFNRRGLRVQYWEHEGPNPCALSHFRTET